MEDSKGKKKYILYTFLAIVAILLVVFITRILPNNAEVPSGNYEDGDAEEGVEIVNSPVTLLNLELLDESIGSTELMDAVKDILKNKILADSEEEDQVTALLSTSSLTEIVYFPFNVFSFSLEVSDGRSYNVQIAKEDVSYMGVFIDYVVPENKSLPNLYVVFSYELSYLNDERENKVDGLIDWVNTNNTGEFLLTTINL